MRRIVLGCFSLFVLMTMAGARAQELRVEVIEGQPESGDLSKELMATLSDEGLRIRQGADRIVCEIWISRQWEIEAGFEASEQRLYPFKAGDLIGLIHFPRRGKDFRNQTVKSGWYTLRFGLQPVDGNHEGTSITRDFLMLVDAAQDAPDKEWDAKELYKASGKALGTTHPALMCLQSAGKGPETTIRHDETHDWWILHALGEGIADQKKSVVALDLVVLGHAAE